MAATQASQGSVCARHALFQIGSVLLALVAITAFVQFRPAAPPAAPSAQEPGTAEAGSGPPDTPEAVATSSGPDDSTGEVAAEPAVEPHAEAVKPEPDRAAIAEAENSLDAASRDRERAEARAGRRGSRACASHGPGSPRCSASPKACVPRARSLDADRVGDGSRWFPAGRARQADKRADDPAALPRPKSAIDPQQEPGRTARIERGIPFRAEAQESDLHQPRAS